MRVVGLTGSIGMGKSTTAAMFAAAGVPVYDADAVVHRLYRGPAVAAVEEAFAGVAVDGKVDRRRLAEAVVGSPDALARLESIIHPLIRVEKAAFLARIEAAGRPLVVLDIPLLFETGGNARVDTIVVVTAESDVQRARVMERPGMTPGKFESLLARQMPDQEKRARAHFIVDTGRGLDSARRRVGAILRALAGAA